MKLIKLIWKYVQDNCRWKWGAGSFFGPGSSQVKLASLGFLGRVWKCAAVQTKGWAGFFDTKQNKSTADKQNNSFSPYYLVFIILTEAKIKTNLDEMPRPPTAVMFCIYLWMWLHLKSLQRYSATEACQGSVTINCLELHFLKTRLQEHNQAESQIASYSLPIRKKTAHGYLFY